METAYRCKIASLAEMEQKWNYEIALHPADQSTWLLWKQQNLRWRQTGEILPYYGIRGGEILCEATAMLAPGIVQNSAGLVGPHTAYLAAFRTNEGYRGQGYFSQLLRFLLGDLKARGYTAATLGVEPCEEKNRLIYAHFGFTQYLKSAFETYPSGAKIAVDYYQKTL